MAPTDGSGRLPAARCSGLDLRQDDAGHRVAVHGNVQAPVSVTGGEPVPSPRARGGQQLTTTERAAHESNDHSDASILRDSPASPLRSLIRGSAAGQGTRGGVSLAPFQCQELVLQSATPG